MKANRFLTALFGLMTFFFFTTTTFAFNSEVNPTVTLSSFDNYRGWAFLGSARVDGHRDRDVIYFGRHGSAPMRALEFRTGNARIDIRRVTIFYTNGEVEKINLRRDRHGAEVHTIDVPGRARSIEKVVLTSKKNHAQFRGRNVRPVVEIWGLSLNRYRQYYNNGFYNGHRYGNYRGNAHGHYRGNSRGHYKGNNGNFEDRGRKGNRRDNDADRDRGNRKDKDRGKYGTRR